MFAKTMAALAVAATLGLSMSAAQARDFDHRGHGFQQTQHHSNARHHRFDHHRSSHHRFSHHGYR